MLKSNRLFSILFNKCPKCHKGKFFKTNNPFALKQFDKMYDKCLVCNEDFNKETGFYVGAMYASYALTVAYGVGLFLLLVVLFDVDVLTFLITFTITLLLLLPWIFRKSRLLWINLFVGKK